MNIKHTTFAVWIVYLLCAVELKAQSVYQFGALPSVNLNNKLKNNWSLNSKIESRQLLQAGEFGGPVVEKYNYLLTDVSLIAAKKVGLNSRIAGGYLARFDQGEVIHRFIQQYIIVQRMAGLRLAHRFLTDQTFSNNEAPDFRVRYRITSEIPLNGESVDPGEFYLKLNNEYVNSFQGGIYDLEIRLVPLLGYDLSANKLEFGLDYRMNSFLQTSAQHNFWMSLNWFIDIGD